MNTTLPQNPRFNNQYRQHLQCLKLGGLQPKTIDAYARAIRRIGNYFDCRIDNLSSGQLRDYFTELLDTHSWSAVKLDLYGLKFFYSGVRTLGKGLGIIPGGGGDNIGCPTTNINIDEVGGLPCCTAFCREKDLSLDLG